MNTKWKFLLTLPAASDNTSATLVPKLSLDFPDEPFRPLAWLTGAWT